MRTTILVVALSVLLIGCNSSLVESPVSGEAAAADAVSPETASAAGKPRALVGAYYFDGWAGHRGGVGDAAWARNAPTHLTERMVTEFPEREPVWGWRDDSVEIMERQIDLAADAGIGFFAFCWYWRPTEEAIQAAPTNTPIPLFLKARNRQRMKFCLLVANHKPGMPQTDEEWRKTADFWMPYLTDPLAVTIDGKPLVILFNPANYPADGFAHLQAAARKAGLPGVAVAGCGANATLEKGFGYGTRYNVKPRYASGPLEHPYKELAAANKQVWRGSPAQPFIPIVTAGWDCRPWEGPKGLSNKKPGSYFPDRTPEQVAASLDEAIGWMDAHPTEATAERLVLMYAWNELGEGGYLVPTQGDPEGGYLKAIRSVVYRSDGGARAAAVREGATPDGTPREPLRVGRLKADRVLFLGNSITRHGPKADIGWTGDWGMAASVAEKDYVHLLADRFATAAGAAPDALIVGGANFERQYATCDLDVSLKKAVDFRADVIIVAIGENVPPLATDDAKAAFRAAMDRLLAKLKHDGATLFVRSRFWPDAAIDGIMRQACQEAGGTFVDIGRLGKDEKNCARSERKIDHSGVAAHPGDKGMAAIADALWAAIEAKSR